jgi:hypothetical protein
MHRTFFRKRCLTHQFVHAGRSCTAQADHTLTVIRRHTKTIQLVPHMAGQRTPADLRARSDTVLSTVEHNSNIRMYGCARYAEQVQEVG